MRDDSARAGTSDSASTSSPSIRSLLRERPLWWLGAATFGLAVLPLVLGRTYFFRDLYLWTFPQRQRLVDLLRAGGLPLWDPFLHGGEPFLGNVNNLALYPTAALSVLMPVVTAVNLEIALHFALVAIAAYLLARSLGLSPSGAVFVAVALVGSGVVLALGNLFNRLIALPHLILLILFWRFYLREGRRGWFVAAAVAGALQLLAGSPEFFLVSFVLAIVWGLVDPPGPAGRPLRRQVLAAAMLGAAAVGLAAVQVLPAAEMVASSERGRRFSSAQAAVWSLSPRRLPELVVPGYFGRVHTLDPADYWGSRFEDEGFPYLLSVFFGMTVLGLAASSAISRRPDGPLPIRTRRFLGATAVFGLILSLGRFLPAAWLERLWSMGGLFRYPVKFLVPTGLAIALLAGDGAERLLLRPNRPESAARKLALILGFCALLLAGAAALLFAGTAAGAAIQQLLFVDVTERARTGLAAAFGQAALFTALASAVFAGRPRLGPRAFFLLTAIVAAELLWAGRDVNPSVSRDFLTKEPPAVAAVHRVLGEGRLFRAEDPPGLIQRAPSNRIEWLYAWNKETLAFYTGAAFGLPVVFHDDFDGLAPARMTDLTRFVRSLPWDRRAPVLSAAAVRAAISDEPLQLDGWNLLGELQNASNRSFFVYVNDRAAPRTGLVHYWKYVPSADQARAAMASPGFDPRRHVVLEGSGPAPSSGPTPVSSLEVVFAGPTRSTVRAETSSAAYLVFSEPLVAGWRVTVDGRDSPIVPANAAFGAVSVPAGRHVVERRYRPMSFYWGGLVSLATVVALCAALRARRPESARPA